MKPIYLILALICTFSLFSCDSDNDQTPSPAPNATVLHRGLDCGDIYVVKFYADVTGLPNNTFDNTYYAQNLPDNLKVDGIEIQVGFRDITAAETITCTAMGPAYPHIFVTAAE